MKNITESGNKKTLLTLIFVLAGLILILLGLVLSVSNGAKNISFSEVFKILITGDKSNLESQIIFDIRLPRALCAILVGCFLATSGAIMQGITRNPIASPSIMGVTQGAAFAVCLHMIYNPIGGPYGRVISAFIGASASSALIFFLSLRKANINVTRMILAGSAIGMLFLSLASMIALLTNHTKDLAFWTAGSLSGAVWSHVRLIAIVSVIALTAVILISPKITILSLGDEAAIGLGEKPNHIRLISLVLVVLLNGTAAAIGGNIGFVCLIVPHIARICIGSDYRYVIPVSMVFGGVLLVFSDYLAKVLASPYEVPLGSITSLIGVPILIYLIRRQK